MMNVWDSATDSNYSILIHAVEDNISNHETAKVDVGEILDINSNRKRSRSDIPVNASIRISAELDELKLMNEKLADDMRNEKDDFNRQKERMLRQLEFMESENIRLKNSVSSLNQKYYEEKKKWQAKLRALELSVDENRNVIAVNIDSSASIGATKYASDSWLKRFEELEILLKEKSNEVLALQLALNSKEEQSNNLEQQILQFKTLLANSNNNVNTIAENSQLRKRVDELEYSLRKRNKEIEQYEMKSHNISLMENNLNQIANKLKCSESEVEQYRSKELQYQTLFQEKEQWKSLFRQIMSKSKIDRDATITTTYDSSPTRNTSDNEISPESVFKYLSDLQKHYLVLLKSQSDTETSLTETKKQLVLLESKYLTEQQERTDLQFQVDRLESRARIQLQQHRIFEGEVVSLRSLLKTFDAEFRFGQPAIADVIRLKEGMIESLRNELDACRRETDSIMTTARAGADLEVEVKHLREKLQSSASTSNSAATATATTEKPSVANTSEASSLAPDSSSSSDKDNVTAENLLLKAQVADLQNQIREMQKLFGIDYVPGRTKVLHLAYNPVTVATAAKSATSTTATATPFSHKVFSNPLDELKHLRAENSRLRDMALQQSEDSLNTTAKRAESTGGGASSGSISGAIGPAGVDMSMNMSAFVSAGSVSDRPATSGTGSQLDSNKLNLRLKELFRERIASFREAVYLLTGYKIDLYAAEASSGGLPRLKLRSMFAEDPDDHLMFQWKGELLELMETPFALKLDQKLFAFLSRCNSVPAFLSNVTLELFERQTFI